MEESRTVPSISTTDHLCQQSRGQSPERLTQERQSITEHHSRPQVVNEIQIRKAASLTIIPEEPVRPGLEIRAAVPSPPHLSLLPSQTVLEADTGWTHLSDTSVAKAASLARMLQERAEPRRLLRTAFMAKILQMLRTLQEEREKGNLSHYKSFLNPAGTGAAFPHLSASQPPPQAPNTAWWQNWELRVYKLPVKSMTHPDRIGFVSFDFRGGNKVLIAPPDQLFHYHSRCPKSYHPLGLKCHMFSDSQTCKCLWER